MKQFLLIWGAGFSVMLAVGAAIARYEEGDA
jgi:hypothetical protein